MLVATASRKRRPIRNAIRLFHRRWSVPVVAVLWREGPLRFVDLLRYLGASRDTLAATLASLIEVGLVEHIRCPDCGRMAYRLTPPGETLAPFCIDCTAAARELNARRVALMKWPMVVLVAVGRGQARYRAVQSELPGITPRALASALKDLVTDGFVVREVDAGYPPRAHYRLSERGRLLFPSMEALIDACEALPA